MLINHKLLMIRVCLLLGILLCVLGCASISTIELAQSDPNSFPVKSLKLTMELDQREEFFTQLQDFAEKHSLQLETTYYDADKKAFFVYLEGDSFHITGGANLYWPREINFGFYNEASPPISQETIDGLFNDLKSFLNEIRNVIIKEKLKRLKITMDKNQSDEVFTKLFTQLQDFAEQHSLEFAATSYDSDMKIFLVEMDGNGFQITSEAVLSPIREMNIDFYVHYDDNGAPTSTSQETAAELFDDLKSSLGEMPNVLITEQK
jgi:hypothetical protein